jgi:hypothetical protein
MLVHQNHGTGGGNGSVMVGMFVCLCLVSKKPSEWEFFVPAGTGLGVKLLMAWSHVISNNQKPPINFPADCLVGKYALPVVYYVPGWTLYSVTKASSIAADKRP